MKNTGAGDSMDLQEAISGLKLPLNVRNDLFAELNSLQLSENDITEILQATQDEVRKIKSGTV